MEIGDISGVSFDRLQLYAEMTGNQQDEQALDTLNQKILAAVPDATPDDVGKAIDRIKTDNPNWTMDQVFEAAIKEVNPHCEAKTITEIRDAWQDFTGATNLSKDDIGEILSSPVHFIINNPDVSKESVVNTLAVLMLLMIEISGKESANQLFEGCQQRDEIMKIAKEKANDIRTKAVINLAVGLTSSAVQAGGSLMAMKSAGKGLSAAKAANAPGISKAQAGSLGSLASSFGAQGSAISGLAQSGSSAVNAVGSLLTGLVDAEIAIKDGESQVASIQKETADKLRQKASEVVKECMDLLKSLSQTRYQTMTAIGRG